jgi:AcrR family transcriptional regulator
MIGQHEHRQSSCVVKLAGDTLTFVNSARQGGSFLNDIEHRGPQGANGLRRRRNQRGKGALLRNEILDAATRLIGQLGDAEALSIRTLAEEVGVTPPSIYRHFDDKAAILRAVVEQRFAAFAQRMDEAEHGSLSPFAALRRRCEAYLRFADEEPGHYRVLFSAASLGPVHIGVTDRPHPGAPSFLALVESVQRCVSAGARPGGDTTFVAIMLWSTLHGFADLRIGKPEMPWPPPEEVVNDLLRRLHLGRKAPRRK